MADIAQLDPTLDLTSINNTTPATSPASSSSGSDSDVVNTASARVYFGPLQSPEKKLIQQIVHPNTSRRRTLNPETVELPSHHSAQFPLVGTPPRDHTEDGDNSDGNDESDDCEEDISQSRSGTPDNVRFPPDEPSSILASRIIRAHDNPSPPPRTRRISSFTSSPLKDASFPSSIDHLGLPDSHIPSNTDIAIKFSTMFDKPVPPSPQSINILTAPPSLTLREASLSPPPPPERVVSPMQNELISFDLVSMPSPSPGPQDVIVMGPSTQPQMSTTVNYLSPSPRRATSPIRIQCELPTDDLRPRLTSPTGHGPRLTPAPPSPTTDGQVNSPYERSSQPDLAPSSPVPPTSTSQSQSEEQRPPRPRRSSRRSVTPRSLSPYPDGPRLSEPPLPPGMATTSSIHTRHETPPVIGAPRLLAEPPSGARTRKKRWKGKEKATSPENESVDDSQEGSSRSGSTESSVRVEPVEDREEMKEKRRMEHAKAKEERMHRELGSLSPGSADVLAQLYPSIQASVPSDGSPVKGKEQKVVDSTDAAPQEQNTSIFPPHPNPFLASVQRPPPGSPVRSTSPSKSQPSPIKLVPNLDLDDPTRTPARRIPIHQAIGQETTSARKLGHVSGYLRPNDSGGLKTSSRSPVFTRRALEDPLRSPARRIPISEASSSVKKSTGTNARHVPRSPVRGVSRERSGSAEPWNGRERSGSVEQQQPMDLPKSSAPLRPVLKLPFPLVATQPSGHDRPTSIPEENELLLSLGTEVPPKKDMVALPPNSSPAKSSLKPPSSSRIPRIGAKPYSRPTMNTKDKKSKLPTVGRKAGADSTVASMIGSLTTNSSKPVRMVRSAGGSGSSSDDINHAGPGGSDHGRNIKDMPGPANLKRKRGTEKTSPSQVRPVVLIRQVVPGMLGPKYAPTTPPAAPHSIKHLDSTQDEWSPVKKTQRPVTMRRVVDKLREKNVARDRFEEEADATDIVDEQTGDAAKKRHRDEDDTLIKINKPSQMMKRDVTPRSSSPILPDHIPVASQDTTGGTALGHPISRSPLVEDDEEPSIKVRRTTRSRKQAALSDVFTAQRPLQQRRKTHSSNRSDADGFSGLSSVALKALTSSNTARNQLNFVNLATEVIRKDGRRPESPIMKVRTISQREAEAKSKGRSERAHRRARRSDDGMSDTDGFSSDRGDSSVVEEEGQWDEDEDELARAYKHRRGPGDEEDYETPAKLGRSLKRPKSGEGMESRETQEKKRVKWDRGLYSEIYLDEIEVKPKKCLKEDIVKKGCLAPTAKALRLDALGNIINADSPLTDLVHENIVVKKFIYDNDVEPEVPVVKSTRSRSKKAKS